MKEIETPAPERQAAGSSARRETVFSAIPDEGVFSRLLALERKRSERTGDAFALMILDVASLNGSAPARKVARICSEMCVATRETDQYGWYRYPTMIGGLFTTLKDSRRDAVEAALAAKTGRALKAALDPADAAGVRMSFHFYPEDFKPDGPGYQPDRVLYRDLARRERSRFVYHFLKRALDIAGSVAGLAVFSPLFLVISILIKLDSKGPAFFRQRRVGRYGREFDFLKFRTMRVNNSPEVHQQYVEKLINGQQPGGETPAGAKPVYKIVNDPRVTRVGRFLRRSSLDEMPQFLNVLKGEMSLVGPRPPLPYEVACYRSWHRRRVIEVKPGITGLWQVNGRSRTTFDEMVRLDLQYIREQSLWLDLKILVKTPAAILSGEGAH